ncbi:hypothetical protein Tco_0723939 [Tanacetum coccineum]
MRWFKEIQITKAPGSDPLGYLPRRLDFLSAQVHNVAKNLPSELTQQFNSAAGGIPKIVSDAIVVHLPDLLSTTLKDILPHMLKDSVKQALPKFDKRVKKTLKAGVDEIVFKPMHKEFNALNTLESRRWNAKHHMQLISYLEQMVHSTVSVPRDITVINAKQLQTKVKKNATDIFELVELTREIVRLMDLAPASARAAAKGRERGEKMSSALVIHSSVDEPSAKKPKVVLEDIPIPSPTLLNFIRPTIINNIPYNQYTANLFSSGSFEFSLAPPPKVANKGKGKAQVFDDD